MYISHYSGACLEGHPIGHTNVVFEDRWSLRTDSITLKCWIFCQEYLGFQYRWSFMAVISQDRFHFIMLSPAWLLSVLVLYNLTVKLPFYRPNLVRW